MRDLIPRSKGHLSDAEVVQLLQSYLTKQLKSSTRRKKQVFLDLFSGTCGIASSSKRLGYGCLSFDINHGEEFDLLRPCVLNLIIGWTRAGIVIGAIFGTPCSSFSRARRGKPDKPDSGRLLRNEGHPWGLPGLSPKELLVASIGNATARSSFRLIREFERLGIPCLLENPVSSQLFYLPPLRRLMKLSSCHFISTDMC